ncbi:MAG TPA: DUF6167 family protein [Aeromicrobium sp.]|nr:DUF6167 family protein [Aeromicrobium sp.]
MMGRTTWFVLGAAAGVYGSVKARRAAYRLSSPGIIDQAAALGVGWRAFSADLREEMRERQDDLVRQLDAAAAERHLHIVATPEETPSQALRAAAPSRAVPRG